MLFNGDEAGEMIHTWHSCPPYEEIREYQDTKVLQVLYPSGEGFVPSRHIQLNLLGDIASVESFIKYAIASDFHILGDSDTAECDAIFDKSVLVEMGIKYRRDEDFNLIFDV